MFNNNRQLFPFDEHSVLKKTTFEIWIHPNKASCNSFGAFDVHLLWYIKVYHYGSTAVKVHFFITNICFTFFLIFSFVFLYQLTNIMENGIPLKSCRMRFTTKWRSHLCVWCSCVLEGLNIIQTVNVFWSCLSALRTLGNFFLRCPWQSDNFNCFPGTDKVNT